MSTKGDRTFISFKYFIVFVFVVLVMSALLLRLDVIFPGLFHKDEVNKVVELITKIEEYNKINGEYPYENKVLDGLGPYFYVRENDSYRIGFYMGFDNCYYYDSASRKWSSI